PPKKGWPLLRSPPVFRNDSYCITDPFVPGLPGGGSESAVVHCQIHHCISYFTPHVRLVPEPALIAANREDLMSTTRHHDLYIQVCFYTKISRESLRAQQRSLYDPKAGQGLTPELAIRLREECGHEWFIDSECVTWDGWLLVLVLS